MKELYSDVSEFLLRASFGVKIHTSVGFGEELIDEVARCLRRRIAVDFSMDHRVEREILASPFLFNRLLMARKAGANIWVTSEVSPAAGLVIQADFGEVLISSASESHSETRLVKSQNADFQILNTFLEVVGTTASEFLPDASDIVLNTWVERGDSDTFIINWSTQNADSVFCDGLGDLRLSGNTALSVRRDTILVFRVSGKNQTRFKALQLKLGAELKVNYDIQFFNPASASFYSLRDAGTPDVYGVVSGTKVRLSWNAGGAEEVEILPFGLKSIAGEHIFYPRDAGEITIRARSGSGFIHVRKGFELEYRIRIKEFPVQVFSQHFTIPDASRLGSVEIQVNNFRMKARHFLEESGFIRHSGDIADGWRKKLFADFERLKIRMKAISFSDFYASHSVPDVNRIVLDRLKQLYPEVWSKKIL